MRLPITIRFGMVVSACLAFFFILGILPVYAATTDQSPQEKWEQQSADFDPDLFSGASSYSISVDVPSGRLGVEPTITVSYNSLNKEDASVLGAGWNIPINRIVRKKVEGVLNLYDSNVFLIEVDGGTVEVRPITLTDDIHGTYGATVEGGFLLVEYKADESWSITTKTGASMVFGTSAQSRIEHPHNPGQIYAWYLNTVQDTNGNFARYSYFKDGVAIYPSTINYTGWGTEAGKFTVRFEPFASGTPTVRPDVQQSFAPGFELTYRYLLSSIEVDVAGSGTVTSYDFGFGTGDNNSRSLLTSVQKTGTAQDGAVTTENPYTFEYTQGTNSWTTDPASQLSNSSYWTSGVAVTDFSGDGKMDVLFHSDRGELNGRIHEGSDIGFVNVTSDWTYPVDPFYGPSTIAADVNNDGYTDMMRSDASNNCCLQWIYLGDGQNGFTDVTNSWHLPPFGFNQSSVVSGDINGDGLLDFIRNEQLTSGFSNEVWLGNGVNGWDRAYDFILPNMGTSPSWRVVDVNRDGLGDVFYAVNSGTGPSGQLLFINNGNGTFSDVSLQWDLADVAFNIGGARISDVNADGFVDIFAGYNVWFGRAFGWDVARESVPTRTQIIGQAYGDINGDGLTDIANEECNVGCSGTMRIHDGEIPDLLKIITTPQGGTVSFGYESSAQLKDDAGNYVNKKLPMVFPVVTSVTYDNGFGDAETIRYFYEGGAYVYSNVYDGRFAGFYKVTTTHSDGSTEVSYFHQGGGEDGSALGENADHIDKLGRAFRTEIYNPQGKLLTTDVTRWDRKDLGNRRAFVSVLQTLNMTYNSNGTHKDRAETYVYDTYGNVTEQTSFGEVTGTASGSFTDIGTDKRVFKTRYVRTTTPYLVGLAYSEQMYDAQNVQQGSKVYLYDNASYGSATKGNVRVVGDYISSTMSYAYNQFTYDVYGNVLTAKNPNYQTTTYIYDADHLYPVTITNALGHTVHQTYNVFGQMVWQKDPNGGVQEWDYDGFGRVREVRRSLPDDEQTVVTVQTISYDTTQVPNRVYTKTYASSTQSAESYQYFDGFGRMIQTRTLLDADVYSVIDTQYDVEDRMTDVVLAYESVGAAFTPYSSTRPSVHTEYDRFNRVIKITDAVGSKTMAYWGRKKTVTDENWNKTAYVYDAYGDLVQVDEYLSLTYIASTKYERDIRGNIVKLTDANNNTRAFTYDFSGNRLSATELHGANDYVYTQWVYSYDRMGNLVRMIDPKGVQTTYKYDQLGRLLQEDALNSVGADMAYLYDSAPNGVGLLASVRRGPIETRLSYDEHGNVVYKSMEVVGETYTTAYTYDWAGKELTRIYPNNMQLSTSYDARGFATHVALDGTVVVTDADYSAIGQMEEVRYGNGVTTHNTYDPNKRFWLTNRITSNATTTLQNLTFTYDSVGNIKLLTDTSDLPIAGRVSYAYDKQYRLVGAYGTSGTQTYRQTFAYNKIGNMVRSLDYGTMYYGQNNANPQALTTVGTETWSYDANGNVVQAGATELLWTYRNELEMSDNGTVAWSYQYDHAGNRVAKLDENVDENIVVYINNYVVDFGRGTKEIHVALNGQPVFVREIAEDDTTMDNWIHSDHLGGVAVMTNAEGDWVSAQNYKPYGEVWLEFTQGDAIDNRFDFTNKERDESGLSYFEARYMHTDYARFMTIDPMFHKTPDFWFVQPQMQNAYSYAVNNPVKYNDPSGEVVPLLAAWAAFEVSMAVYDTYDLAHTLSNKNASTQTKAVTVGAYAAGLYLPGGGYGTLGKQAIKQADEAVAVVKNVPKISKAVVNNVTSAVEQVDDSVRIYTSHSAFRRGEGSAGAERQWHHEIEQNKTNVQQFGSFAIHNTQNVTSIPTPLHRQISGYYSRKVNDTIGTVREWVSKQPYEKQKEIGQKVSNMFKRK